MADTPNKTSSQPFDPPRRVEPLLQSLDSAGNGSAPARANSDSTDVVRLLRQRSGQVGSPQVDWGAFPLLARIDGPDDLKRLDVAQLKTLAEEIRRFIIESVSKTGGHLASNLGVVDITLALHYVFDFSKDKLLWDVGHQCYAHKIITGRKAAFAHLRQSGGLSGFPNPQESDYDLFAVGHAGTSIATAIGMALGQTHLGANDKVVALVGDASIVNGTSFEALNNLGLVKRQMLIVLNDNSMAIDPTQGAVAKYFSRIRLSQTYEDLRRTTNAILEHTPLIGKTVEEAIERIKKTIRMVLPASHLFESLNIPYFGPVDGHDIGSLIKLFRALGGLSHPAILHCYTKKGEGYSPAGSQPSKFHSTGPFKINGEATDPRALSPGDGGGRQTFTREFGEQLLRLAEKDNRIVAITSAMCDGTGLGRFREKFPDRFYDVGIAESAAVDIAAGLAKSGLKPVVCIYSTFLQRSIDQIYQDAAMQNLPVIFCIDRAGVVGADGPTHHGLMDVGYLRMMPNMVLISPANAAEVALALEFAVSHCGPVGIRYPKDYVPADTPALSAKADAGCSQPFKLGKSVVVRRADDSQATLVSFGSVLAEAMAAADALAVEGITVDVINARFAAPVDADIVRLLDDGKPIFTVEDHGADCGFGSAVLELAARTPPLLSCDSKTRGRGRVYVLAAPRHPISHDTRRHQLMQAGLSADKIAEAVRKVVKRQK